MTEKWQCFHWFAILRELNYLYSTSNNERRQAAHETQIHSQRNVDETYFYDFYGGSTYFTSTFI